MYLKRNADWVTNNSSFDSPLESAFSCYIKEIICCSRFNLLAHFRTSWNCRSLVSGISRVGNLTPLLHRLSHCLKSWSQDVNRPRRHLQCCSWRKRYLPCTAVSTELLAVRTWKVARFNQVCFFYRWQDWLRVWWCLRGVSSWRKKSQKLWVKLINFNYLNYP